MCTTRESAAVSHYAVGAHGRIVEAATGVVGAFVPRRGSASGRSGPDGRVIRGRARGPAKASSSCPIAAAAPTPGVRRIGRAA